MTPDDLDQRLARLPAPDLDDQAAERVRRRALAALAEERSLQARPFARAWSRLVTPTLLVGAVGGYLTWVFAVVTAIYK